MTGSRPPAVDAVIVWRGWLNPAFGLEQFYERVGPVFLPASPVLQRAAGLYAYLPAVTAGLPGKPRGVPDQTALLWWDQPRSHEESHRYYGVRLYHLIHTGVYGDPPPAQAWPVPFDGEVVADQPYHLLDQPADWMHGTVTHVVGSRPDGVAPGGFRAGVAGVLVDVRTGGGAAGAVACASDDHVVYWVLGDGAPGVSAIADLCAWKHVVEARPVDLTATTVDDDWPGLTVGPGDCIQPQYRRRGEA